MLRSQGRNPARAAPALGSAFRWQCCGQRAPWPLGPAAAAVMLIWGLKDARIGLGAHDLGGAISSSCFSSWEGLAGTGLGWGHAMELWAELSGFKSQQNY